MIGLANSTLANRAPRSHAPTRNCTLPALHASCPNGSGVTWLHRALFELLISTPQEELVIT
jgi:hypothetical protein